MYYNTDPTAAECTTTADTLNLMTPNEYTYKYLDERGLCYADKGSMTFWVKAEHDAHISLADAKGNEESIELVIGGWSDSKSVLRFSHQVMSIMI